MSQLTTHILDTSIGKPAAGVEIILFQQEGSLWKEIAKAKTNHDGRVADLVASNIKLKGIYKLKFETESYFQLQNIQSLYPYVEISFEIASSDHYHIPLLLNPFGYTTYRGS